MVRRKKDQPPMKYWGFYCPDELKQLTIACAEKADMSDSEYIRNAITEYNLKHMTFEVDSTHKNNTVLPIPEYASFAKNNTVSNQSICESIQKSINEDIHNGKYEGVKPYKPKSSMVHPLPKGGGKK